MCDSPIVNYVPHPSFKTLFLPYYQENELNESHNEATRKIQTVCHLAEQHAIITDKLVIALEDVFDRVCETTQSELGTEHPKQQLTKHLRSLSKSKRTSARIKKKLEKDPRWFLAAIQVGALIKQLKSELKTGESAKDKLERQLKRTKKLASDAEEELQSLERTHVQAEQNLKQLREHFDAIPDTDIDMESQRDESQEWTQYVQSEESEGETIDY